MCSVPDLRGVEAPSWNPSCLVRFLLPRIHPLSMKGMDSLWERTVEDRRTGMQTPEGKRMGCVVCGGMPALTCRWVDLIAVVCKEHARWTREQVRAVIEKGKLDD